VGHRFSVFADNPVYIGVFADPAITGTKVGQPTNIYFFVDSLRTKEYKFLWVENI
jgi:hypothetical protein